MGGIVSYHPLIKEHELNVQSRVLRETGSVSHAVAKEMAAGISRRFQADIGLGVTGIAGPSGGSEKNPVGLVFAAISSSPNLISEEFHFQGTRNSIRHQVCVETLRLLVRKLLQWQDKVQ